MTKDEFLSGFNGLFNSEEAPDALRLEEFRTNVLADYDLLATAQTAVQSFTATNEELTKQNKALQETNMKLIMLHPEAINLGKDKPSNEDEETEEKELSNAEKQKELDSVLEAFGHKK